MHVPRREFERNFEIVILAENARIKLKSSANERLNLPRPIASSFVKIGAELSVRQQMKKRSMWPAGNWSESFEKVLLAKCAQIEPKRSANESERADVPAAPELTMIRAKLTEQWSFEMVPCSPPGIGAKF
jgi:hypothetical protein